MENNIFRRLREALHLTQQQYAHTLGMSIASIQNFEKGLVPSEKTLQKMIGLAAQEGRVDIVDELNTRQFGVRKVFKPGDRVRLPLATSDGRGLSDYLHEMIDRIVESGDADLIGLLESTVQTARRVLDAKPAQEKTKKTAGK